MKTLLLLRHAKSSWAEAGVSDHERPLNERGQRDAPQVGRLVKKQGLTPSLIVSSSAKRARKTAAKVAEHCGYQGEVQTAETLYLASAEKYLEFLRLTSDEHATVLVVGHNPGLEDLVEKLTGHQEQMPTAALAQVALEISEWRELARTSRGQLVHVWRPKEQD